MISDDPELNALVDRAIAAFNRLTPHEQTEHRREQAVDFVYGNLRLSGRAVDRKQIEQVYDEMDHDVVSRVMPRIVPK